MLIVFFAIFFHFAIVWFQIFLNDMSMHLIANINVYIKRENFEHEFEKNTFFFLFIIYLLHAINFYVVSFFLSSRWSIRHNKHSINIDISVSCLANSLTQWNRTERWIEESEKKNTEIWILQNMKSEKIKRRTLLTSRFRPKRTLLLKCLRGSRRRSF